MQRVRTILFPVWRQSLGGCSLVAAVALGLMFSTQANAQSLFGSSGALSNTAASNGGGRASGGMSGGSTGSSGASGFGGGGTGGGMFGASGGTGARSGGAATGAAGGQSSLTRSSLNAGDGSLGDTVGMSGFVGRGDTAGRFVGSQNASRQRVTGNSQQFSALQNRNNLNANSNTTPPKQLLRPQVQLGFESPLAMTPPVPGNMQTRIAELPAVGSRAAGVRMQLDSAGVLTLTGTVTSEDDRRMMEILTRMEPGVRDVRNELQISP